MSSPAERWLMVVLVCLVYLCVQAYTDASPSPLGVAITHGLLILVGYAVVLAALDSLGVL